MNTEWKLWFQKPASQWEEALPIGNGRLGGMVYGNVYTEQIQLNEDSVWYGGKQERNNRDAKANLPKIRELILQGKIKEAEELSALALSGTPEGQRHYEPLGNLYLFFANEKGKITDYRRELDLETGSTNTTYTLDGVQYTRNIFASYPAQAMIIHMTADQKGKLSFHTQLARGNETWNTEPFSTYKFRYNGGFNAYVDRSNAIGEDGSVMVGQCGGKDAIGFSGAIKVKAVGGSVQTIGNSVVVKEADEVTILLSASTTYRVEDPEQYCITHLEEVSKKTYEELYKEHVKDYMNLYSRVQIDLCVSGDRTKVSLPINERLERVLDGEEDLQLVNLLFQYGRYLLIASSRPGSLPATLQGIWNKEMLPIWDSKYTININTEMNYWPAEAGNLSECHLPLFELVERMRENGRKTAQEMYGCRGFMAHHNTDIWADTAPQDVCLSSTYWVMGAAWLCLHLWEHYQFTKDEEFLQQAYPTMREAAQFLLDFLIEDGTGNLITCPTISPENEYRLPNGETGVLCKGASMDNQIIHELFTACREAASILTIDEEFCQTLLKAEEHVPKPQIGKYGQIMEWVEDYEEIDPGHRHISHLFALYPGSQISLWNTKELAKAARITLERRLVNGGGHTGWSRAWIINMWARLGDGEQAYKNIVAFMQKSVLPNLFCNHPPFQIDGNFGATAGILEMLLQSHEGELNLLPALPKAWNTGYVRGVKARGGYEVDLSWENQELKQVEIKAKQEGTVRLRYKDMVMEVKVHRGRNDFGRKV